MRAALVGLDVRRHPDAPGELLALPGRDDAERVRPELLDRGGETRLVPEARRPQLGVQPVVDLLAVDLRRKPCELCVARLLQRLDANAVRLLVEVAARDRQRPVVEQPQLDERRARVLRRLPVERERIRVGAELRGGELVQRACVADLVLRDRRERDVLLERRRDPRPLRVAPPDDQLVVGQAQQQVRALAVLAGAAVQAGVSRLRLRRAYAAHAPRPCADARSRASASRALIE